MSDYIKKEDVLGIIVPRMNSAKIGSLENQRLYSVLEEIRKMPAFDLESVIRQLEEKAIEELGINKSQFAMDKGEYSSYCSLCLCNVIEILKSAANATNRKNGG